MKFKLLIEIVSSLDKVDLIEVGGRLLEGHLEPGSIGYVETENGKIQLRVIDVAFLRPSVPGKIALSVKKPDCYVESLIGKIFFSD